MSGPLRLPRRRGDVVVFLGPSLPPAEARRAAPAPAAASSRRPAPATSSPCCRRRPLAIALVDGLFEAVPSVWHHELLAAQAAGVQVFGGASMGALRAAELGPWGVVGVGRDLRVVPRRRGGGRRRGGAAPRRRGARVAAAHRAAGRRARRGRGPRWRRAAARRARGARCWPPRPASSTRTRTWPARRSRRPGSAPSASRPALRRSCRPAPSQKAEDARATILAAARLRAGPRRRLPAAAARARAAPPLPRPPPPARLGPLHPAGRRRWARPAAACARRRVLRRLAARPDAGRLAADGLRRALLARAWPARSASWPARPTGPRRSGRWLASLGVTAARRATAFLAACGLDEGSAAGLAEGLALEGPLLAAAGRALPRRPVVAGGAGARGAAHRRLGRGGGAPRAPGRRATRARLGGPAAVDAPPALTGPHASGRGRAMLSPAQDQAIRARTAALPDNLADAVKAHARRDPGRPGPHRAPHRRHRDLEGLRPGRGRLRGAPPADRASGRATSSPPASRS